MFVIFFLYAVLTSMELFLNDIFAKLGCSLETALDLIARTNTQMGLKVFTTVIDKIYQTGAKVSEDFKNNMQIVFDDFLPQWNYTAKPQQRQS